VGNILHRILLIFIINCKERKCHQQFMSPQLFRSLLIMVEKTPISCHPYQQGSVCFHLAYEYRSQPLYQYSRP